MPTLQELQAPIDRLIVEELVAATPEHWNSAVMTVERHVHGGKEKLAIAISSPEDHREVVSATHELIEALYQLVRCFSQKGKTWTKVQYIISLGPNDTWKFEANFDY